MRRTLLPALLVAWTAVLLTSAAQGENWPGWRGPRGDGSSLETGVPRTWSATENIAWKVPVPGVGHASPVVWEDRIFTVSCRQEQRDRILVCLDRRDGRLLWQQVVLEAPLEMKHHLNSYASSTPAVDGRRVYVSFLEPDQGRADGSGNPTPGNMVVAAYDLEGRRQWLARPGRFSSKHGFCSSPVLYDDLVIVNGDHDGDSYILALDRATGKTRWKVPREYKTRSYCVPLIRQIEGRTQMILSGSKRVTSYNPSDGSILWYIEGPTEQFVASLVYGEGLLFLTAGYPEHHLLAIDPRGSGDVTDSHILWRETRGAAYVPSPIAVGNYFLVVSDNGIGSCFEAKTGRRTWMQRLGRHYSASAVSAEGLAYFLDDDGITKVIAPGDALEVVAVNDLGEPCYASPAISQGQIFIRTQQHLFCIGKPTAAE